ncbi:nucleolar protein dao-5-like [Watersipora subatra]|uniref:nucleolar protein dao-5-like n=1 Tax=Watersipora subatra TaxID=2589382 RepID=UPI00355AE78A
MREAKGRENLNDRILLGRKRKETGAKKPERKKPEPPKPPKPRTPVFSPSPQPRRRPIAEAEPKSFPAEQKVHTPEVVSPPPRAPSPVRPAAKELVSESDSDYDNELRTRSPSPKPQKENQQQQNPAPKQSEKQKVAESKTPARKGLFDYYSKGAPSKQSVAASKYSLQKGTTYKPTKSPPPQITPPPKSKRKKKGRKKRVAGFTDFSSSEESETEAPKNQPKVTHAKERMTPVKNNSTPVNPKKTQVKEDDSCLESSSEEERTDVSDKRKSPVVSAPLREPTIESSSEESSEDESANKEVNRLNTKNKIGKAKGEFEDYSHSDEEKPAVTATKSSTMSRSASDTDSDSDSTDESVSTVSKATSKKTEEVNTKSKLSADSVVVTKEVIEQPSAKKKVVNADILETTQTVGRQVSTVAPAAGVVATGVEAAKQDKVVHWDADVTSPKPTARKPKKDRKNKKEKNKKKLDVVKEEDEEIEKKEIVVRSEGKKSVENLETGLIERPTSESRLIERPASTKSDNSSQVEHVREDPTLTGPVFPSTLSLQSRHSQQVAQADLLPSALEQKDELERELSAMNDQTGKPVTPANTVNPVEKPSKASKKPVEAVKKHKRELSPYKVLPDIPSTEKKRDWPPIAALQGEAKQSTDDSLIVYAKPHKKGGSKKEKRDMGPYLEALDKACDSSLQYIVAKTGAQLGLANPNNVFKARVALQINEKKAAKLDQKILARLQNENGAYRKRIDKFLNKP